MFFFQDMDQQPFIRNGLELQNEVLCKKIKKKQKYFTRHFIYTLKQKIHK